MHRRVRRRFHRNPYTVNNINDMWECDLVDVRGLSKYNGGVKYLLTLIVVCTKFLHIVPLLPKTGKSVTNAFQTIFNDAKRPIWVRTDRGKEFANRSFQDILKREGIQFQVCKIPDIKCSVIQRAHRTICDKLFKYFTFKNTYKFMDVLPKFVECYNATVHGTTGIAPAIVTEKDVLAIWNRMNEKRSRMTVSKPKFRVGPHVSISKEKMKFAKGGKKNYTTEIFRIMKVLRKTPRPVNELEDLNKVIYGQLYEQEL